MPYVHSGAATASGAAILIVYDDTDPCRPETSERPGSCLEYTFRVIAVKDANYPENLHDGGCKFHALLTDSGNEG